MTLTDLIPDGKLRAEVENLLSQMVQSASDALRAEKDAEIDALKATITDKADALAAEAEHAAAVKSALSTPDPIAAIAILVAEKERPDKDKKLAELDAIIAEKQAERDSIAASLAQSVKEKIDRN